MVVLKPTPRGSSLFRVFKPFSPPVWTLVISSIVVCALLFHGTVTLWNRNREISDNGDTEYRERNSFIHTLMVIYSQLNVHQSVTMSLHSMSSRCVLAFWMLFCILITTSYTSELIGYLTVSDTKPTINSLKDLANSETVFPVTAQGSSVITIFQVNYFLSWQRSCNSNRAFYYDVCTILIGLLTIWTVCAFQVLNPHQWSWAKLVV